MLSAFTASAPLGVIPPFKVGDWNGFISTIEHITKAEVEAPSASQFCFKYIVDAMEHNDKLLKSFNYNFERVVQSNPNTIISYGSELQPIDQLQPLLRHHPMWNDFDACATNEIDYPLTEPLSEEERVQILDENIQRGNHKSIHPDKGGPASFPLWRKQLERFLPKYMLLSLLSHLDNLTL